LDEGHVLELAVGVSRTSPGDVLNQQSHAHAAGELAVDPEELPAEPVGDPAVGVPHQRLEILRGFPEPVVVINGHYVAGRIILLEYQEPVYLAPVIVKFLDQVIHAGSFLGDESQVRRSIRDLPRRGAQQGDQELHHGVQLEGGIRTLPADQAVGDEEIQVSGIALGEPVQELRQYPLEQVTGEKLRGCAAQLISENNHSLQALPPGCWFHVECGMDCGCIVTAPEGVFQSLAGAGRTAFSM